jgi:mannosyl-oligosaccharide alpha-1,2-mannosidase
LEFTRLSQITGNDKYFDGIQRIMNELEKWQDHTSLPGMWPAKVNSAVVNETVPLTASWGGSNDEYTLGALADSAYEYLPKVGRLPLCRFFFWLTVVGIYSSWGTNEELQDNV